MQKFYLVCLFLISVAPELSAQIIPRTNLLLARSRIEFNDRLIKPPKYRAGNNELISYLERGVKLGAEEREALRDEICRIAFRFWIDSKGSAKTVDIVEWSHRSYPAMDVIKDQLLILLAQATDWLPPEFIGDPRHRVTFDLVLCFGIYYNNLLIGAFED